MGLSSKTLFEAIIEVYDQAALDPTYLKWLEGLFSREVSTALTKSAPLVLKLLIFQECLLLGQDQPSLREMNTLFIRRMGDDRVPDVE